MYKLVVSWDHLNIWYAGAIQLICVPIFILSPLRWLNNTTLSALPMLCHDICKTLCYIWLVNTIGFSIKNWLQKRIFSFLPQLITGEMCYFHLDRKFYISYPGPAHEHLHFEGNISLPLKPYHKKVRHDKFHYFWEVSSLNKRNVTKFMAKWYQRLHNGVGSETRPHCLFWRIL